MPTNREPSPPAPAGDRDHDGIPDDRDKCPDQPEDYDLYADDDGCPDPDNDGDGFPDDKDDCPYTAGANGGCVKPCKAVVISSDDCFLDPTVFYDAHDVPHQDRVDEVVRIVRGHASVQALEVVGQRAELVAAPLRARLPGIEIKEDHRDTGRPRALWVRITRQRFDEGRFRTMECTPFGAIYTPARPNDCMR